MPRFGEWFGGSRHGRPAEGYVHALMEEPDPADVAWLAEVATSGDADRARWELRYLRRAIGLLVAQRDALDDLTGSSVARLLTEAMAADRNVAATMIKLSERQFNERLSAYREMMALRGSGEGIAERVGRTLLLLSGSSRIGSGEVQAGAALVERYLDASGERLRKAFGVASLPEGSPPPRA